MTTSAFQKTKIKDVLVDYRKPYLPSENENLPYIGLEHIEQQTLRLNSVGTSSEVISQKKKFIKNSILYGSLRPYFRKVIKPNFDGVCSTDITVLIPKSGNNVTYLFYLISSPEFISKASNAGNGTKMPRAGWNVIKDFVFDVPDVETQSKIASILSPYDNLIENNEKRIKILEEMAQLLYTEWFVKFKFLGNEKVKMIDGLPNGWKYEKLEKVANIVRGCSYSSEEIDDNIGDYYIVNLKSFNRGGGFRYDGAKYYSGKINTNQSLKTGDIVVAVTDMTSDRAVIARPARVLDISGKITFSADVVKIISDSLPNSFIFQLLSTHRFTETTKQMANGANVLHLRPTAILEFIALIPDKHILDRFDQTVNPILIEIDKLIKQNDILTKTRDLLIPQLVNGRKLIKE